MTRVLKLTASDTRLLRDGAEIVREGWRVDPCDLTFAQLEQLEAAGRVETVGYGRLGSATVTLQGVRRDIVRRRGAKPERST